MGSKDKSVKVPLDIATTEVNNWLDAKRITEKKRQEYADFIENLIEGVMEGFLVVNNDNTLTQNLAFPILDENQSEVLNSLRYKFRISEADKIKYRKSVQKDDNGFMLTLLALTDAPRGHITLLDSSVDKPLADAIALFFL